MQSNQQNQCDNIQSVNNYKNILDLLVLNKDTIFSLLFYISGLILGSSLYKILDGSSVHNVINLASQGSSGGFLPIFLNNVCVYLITFLLCFMLGLCVIGFSFVKFIPLLCGFEIALKLSYYYVNFGAKGVGYALLILLPSISLLITIIVLTTDLSSNLSKYLYRLVNKKSGIIENFNLKSYLIKYFIYAIFIVVSSVLGALLNYLLSSLITL